MIKYLLLLMSLSSCIDYRFDQSLLPPQTQYNNYQLSSSDKTDTIIQTFVPLIDILWVVDSSSSMVDNQYELYTNFPLLMEDLIETGLDYHIGVTTTDMDFVNNGTQGTLREINGIDYITPETPNAIDIFTEMAAVGVNGSNTERGLAAAFSTLENQRNNNNIQDIEDELKPHEKGESSLPFYRDDAVLHTIIVSDEKDQSDELFITVPEFISWYKGLKAETYLRRFHSIVCTTGTIDSACFSSQSLGIAYVDVTEHIGGVVKDISSNSWSDTLSDLGTYMTSLPSEFFMSEIPLPSSIMITSSEIPGLTRVFEQEEWTYSQSRNSITFTDYLPPSFSVITINYTLATSITQ